MDGVFVCDSVVSMACYLLSVRDGRGIGLGQADVG